MLAFAALAPPGHGAAVLAQHRAGDRAAAAVAARPRQPVRARAGRDRGAAARAERLRALGGRAAGARRAAGRGRRTGAVRAARRRCRPERAHERRRDRCCGSSCPYVAMTTFVVGLWWRYRADQFGWTSGSTQIFEHKILGWAGPAFHYGALAAIGGHVIGLMIPKSFTEAVGMSEHTYRWFSAIAGAVAGAVCIVGFFGLVYRRVDQRARAPHDVAHGPARVPAARRADRHGLLDDDRLQPGHRSRRTTTATRCRCGGARCSSCSPTSRRCRTRTLLPGPRDHRLGVLGGVPVQPAGPHAQHPAAVPGAAVHPLPAPVHGRSS